MKLKIRELRMMPKVAFGSFTDHKPVEIVGFSHYGPVHSHTFFQKGNGWIRMGSVFFGRVRTDFEPGFLSIFDEAIKEAGALNQRLGTEHVLLALIARGGRSVDALVEFGLTETRARELLAARPAQEDKELGEAVSLDLADIEALAKIGINWDQVKSSIEREFGPVSLATGSPPAQDGSGPVISDEVLQTVGYLAAAAALRFGSTTVSTDHAVLGLVNSASVNLSLLRPLNIGVQAASGAVGSVLAAAGQT